MSLLVVLGTRPEVVKLVPVVRECRRRGLPLQFLSTGQHREILDRAFADLGLTPDLDLELMEPGQSLARLSAKTITALDSAYTELEPRYVVVQGDTTTVAMAALVAYYHRIPVGHVEAGLRSGSRLEPFPEEINRQMVSTLAHDHFAPTARAADNLRRAGVDEAAIHVVGNTVIDALFSVRDQVASQPLAALAPELAGLTGPIAVLTCHRRESFGPPLVRIAEGVARLARAHPELNVVYPVHPNPAIRGAVEPVLGGLPNVLLCAPLAYPALVKLMTLARFVITDSGGLQEEAAALGVPCLVARKVTDRPEAVDSGVAMLVGRDSARIASEGARLLVDDAHHAAMARAVDVFGDGRASVAIADVLERRLSEEEP